MYGRQWPYKTARMSVSCDKENLLVICHISGGNSLFPVGGGEAI
jgi:hypothetical protein